MGLKYSTNMNSCLLEKDKNMYRPTYAFIYSYQCRSGVVNKKTNTRNLIQTKKVITEMLTKI